MESTIDSSKTKVDSSIPAFPRHVEVFESHPTYSKWFHSVLTYKTLTGAGLFHIIDKIFKKMYLIVFIAIFYEKNKKYISQKKQTPLFQPLFP